MIEPVKTVPVRWMGWAVVRRTILEKVGLSLKLQCGSKGDVTVVMTVNDMGLNDRDETRRMAIANKTCVSGKKLISIIDYDVCMTFY